jgi:hypothetical protein
MVPNTAKMDIWLPIFSGRCMHFKVDRLGLGGRVAANTRLGLVAC